MGAVAGRVVAARVDAGMPALPAVAAGRVA